MMEPMALLQELMTMIIILATKPFCLCKSAILFCLKTTLIVIHTWMELIKAFVDFHANMVCGTIMWTAALVTLPIRVLTALHRERLLAQNLQEMQLELETLRWEKKELEDHLQTAIKGRKIMESLLAELEEENEKAFAKIKLLKDELQGLKDETLQLKEICGNGQWSFKVQDVGNGKNIGIAENYGITYGIPSWQSSFKGSEFFFQDLMMHKDTWQGESKSNTELLNLFKTGFAATGPVHPYTHGVVPRILEANEVFDRKREVALSQSLFSALLSLLVGMIIWEAEDPCMPLVVALFTVVGMSLRSVVQFLSTVKNKPASGAVALLSFSCFILGILTYPTLPKVARALAPLAPRFVNRTTG